MIRKLAVGILISVISFILIISSCEKEKIVESTEYIHEIEYIELAPDTVFRVDTVFSGDSIIINNTDTILVFDTVMQVNHVYDTVTVLDTIISNQHHYDTTIVIDTVLQVSEIHDTTYIFDTVITVQHHYDTVTTVQHHYDTTIMVDTVQITDFSPNEHLAFAALQYYSDDIVFDVISTELGIDGGWVFYLSGFQHDLAEPSSGVYDIYGFIDYWTPDWADFYPFEYYWRMIYIGGDPADPQNWDITEPPVNVSGFKRGITPTTERTSAVPLKN
jgi:hypothetical protein